MGNQSEQREGKIESDNKTKVKIQCTTPQGFFCPVIRSIQCDNWQRQKSE